MLSMITEPPTRIGSCMPTRVTRGLFYIPHRLSSPAHMKEVARSKCSSVPEMIGEFQFALDYVHHFIPFPINFPSADSA